MKLISRKHTYTNSKGEEKQGYNYYLVLDNGNKIAIKPSFNSDYAKLFLLSEHE